MAVTANGMATAIQLAGGVGEAREGDEQAEMFAPLEGALPLTPAKGRSGEKGGRPAGARNKSSLWWRDRFLTRYESPLMACGEIYSRTAAELAEELYLTRIVGRLAPGQAAIETLRNPEGEVTGHLVWDLQAAVKIQQEAIRDVLPYVHQRQAPALPGDGSGRGLGLLMIGDLGGGSGDALAIFPYVENQGVSADGAAKSHGEQSHDSKKPCEDAEILPKDD